MKIERISFCVGAVLVGFALQVASIPDASAKANEPSRDEVCQSLKLRAVGDYYQCLLRTDGNEALESGCDDRFARAFENADRHNPDCGPLNNLERTQRAVRDQARAVLVGAVSVPPCQDITAAVAGDESDGVVTCWLHKPSQNTDTSGVNLLDIVTQLQEQDSADCAPCQDVDNNTPLWLQAWGGMGGNSDHAGDSGFAQMVTTINGLLGSGSIDLFYYLGAGGTHHKTGGGAGGAATIVTPEELTVDPDAEPNDSAILIAGGGGGGGGRDTACLVGDPSPHNGGNGGVAISKTGEFGEAVGQGDDSSGSSGGKGGGQGLGGDGSTSSENGMDGIGGMGGKGGKGADGHSSGPVGWINTGATTLTFTSGAGGNGGNDTSTCTSGGGGGGGGWGGGGGGSHGNSTTKADGGGGGGSVAVASTCKDSDAPTEYVANPAGSDGTVLLVFNTKGTCATE